MVHNEDTEWEGRGDVPGTDNTCLEGKRQHGAPQKKIIQQSAEAAWGLDAVFNKLGTAATQRV